MYKPTTVVALSLLSAGGVQGENIFNSLLNIQTVDHSKSNPGISKQNIGDSRFYFYKLNRGEVSREGDVEDTLIIDEVIKTLPDEIEAAFTHPVNRDLPSYEPVIDQNPVEEELGTKADVHEKDLVYGDNGILEDINVKLAWDKAHEAQAALDAHRKEMEALRKARKAKEAAKKVDIARE
jgi:hypothetical protein